MRANAKTGARWTLQRAWILVAVSIVIGVARPAGAASPRIARQEFKLIASDGGYSDQFGFAVALSGDTALVGVPDKIAAGNLGQGGAYFFVRSGGNWTFQTQVTASDGRNGDGFGGTVAIEGDTAIIGTFGRVAAYVFVRNGTQWSEQGKLVPNDGVFDDGFGSSIALHGDMAIIGSPGKAQFRGAAYVFVRSGDTWSQQAKISAMDGLNGDDFGVAVGLAGTKALIGADGKTVGSNVNQGVVYVFEQTGSVWSQRQKLVASDGTSGDFFGDVLATSGGRAIVGAPGSTSGTRLGRAYIFAENGTWSEEARLMASDGIESLGFGAAVALSGGTALVGAFEAGTGNNFHRGSVYLYTWGAAWTEEAHWAASDGAVNDNFGDAVALDGAAALVGADAKPVGTNAIQGVSYIYELSGLLGAECASSSDCATAYVCNARHCSTACHQCAGGDPSTCSPLSGVACDDGNACSQVDTCENGTCIGTSPVSCAASDVCHVAGSCNPSTGVCSNPVAASGSLCDDGNACTKQDSCQNGVCQGASPVVCAPIDACHLVGSCDRSTGTCTNPPAPDGVACTGGTCMAGRCEPFRDAGAADTGPAEDGQTSTDGASPDEGGPEREASPMLDAPADSIGGDSETRFDGSPVDAPDGDGDATNDDAMATDGAGDAAVPRDATTDVDASESSSPPGGDRDAGYADRSTDSDAVPVGHAADPSGCSCRATGRYKAPRGVLVLLVACLLRFRRRRRHPS